MTGTNGPSQRKAQPHAELVEQVFCIGESFLLFFLQFLLLFSQSWQRRGQPRTFHGRAPLGQSSWKTKFERCISTRTSFLKGLYAPFLLCWNVLDHGEFII